MEKQKTHKKSAFRRAASTLFINYFAHGVGKHSAGLAYYLLFAIFPMLIFVSNLVGLLNLNVYAITRVLDDLLPKVVVSVIESYLDYITHTSSPSLLIFSLIFTIWFPMRAAAGLMDDVRRAYGEGMPKNLFLYILKQLVYTLLLLVVIVLTLIMTVMGKQVIINITELFKNNIDLSTNLLGLWQYLRFVPIALLMIVAISTLYAFSLDNVPKFRTILPGILSSLVLWLIFSVGFSFYVENYTDQSVFYGTLGTLITLLLWLYMTALSLILGAELNATIYKIKNEKVSEVEEQAELVEQKELQ